MNKKRPFFFKNSLNYRDLSRIYILLKRTRKDKKAANKYFSRINSGIIPQAAGHCVCFPVDFPGESQDNSDTDGHS